MIHTTPRQPIFWAHGTADDEVPISYGEDALRFLASFVGVPTNLIQFEVYEGLRHAIADAELDALAQWIARVLQ